MPVVCFYACELLLRLLLLLRHAHACHVRDQKTCRFGKLLCASPVATPPSCSWNQLLSALRAQSVYKWYRYATPLRKPAHAHISITYPQATAITLLFQYQLDDGSQYHFEVGALVLLAALGWFFMSITFGSGTVTGLFVPSLLVSTRICACIKPSQMGHLKWR